MKWAIEEGVYWTPIPVPDYGDEWTDAREARCARLVPERRRGPSWFIVGELKPGALDAWVVSKPARRLALTARWPSRGSTWGERNGPLLAAARILPPMLELFYALHPEHADGLCEAAQPIPF